MPLTINEPVERMDRPYARRWWALLVLCLSLLIAVMANTALTVAAPDMTRDLDLSSSDLQWVIDAYTVPYAALMLLFGAIGDKYSRRGALVLGLLVLSAGAAAGALADTSTAVIVARGVMGVGAAMIMPATLSLLAATFPREERAKAITLWAATSGIAIAAGPLIAGLLLEDHGWASTFLIDVPVAAVAIVGAFVFVPPSKSSSAGRIDYVGGLLSVVWIGALIYMIIEGPGFGWGASAVTAAVVAAVGLVVFVVWELRHPRPVLDVRKFAQRGFSGSNLAVSLFFVAAFGAFYFLTQHLQFVLEYDPLETGVRMLPLAGAVFVGSALTGFLTPRLGAKVMVTAGMVGGTTALALLTAVDATSSYGDFVLPLVVLGLSMGLAVSPCTDAIMGAFPESELGVGGAVNDTSLELGGSLGIAVLGSVLGTSYADGLADETAGSKLPASALEQAQDSVGAGGGVAQAIGQQAQRLAEQAAGADSPRKAAELKAQAAELAQGAEQMKHAVGTSFSDAVAHTSLVGAVVLGVGTLIVAVLLPRKGRTPAEPARTAAAPAPDARKEPVSQA
ncbi:MFS transporter [Streptomyces spectabilis]|uniref:DHA2 family efflux MFS transporter permease subunit n=1 Tax=Streptomyces spectabilis TaxID=68270 RepID=A0A5P2XCR0_STRST|nr:MFS transporter [Streptomyces spectabilis]MBB5104412.1 EmrB/QacA subfamily drug resistance transporter [Streptomyces spectabilis]MCI3905233.1 MFS transporter [Streptomyces spectabilis]QEV62241.1 DHA2 family efflux MFS transporter permease subunit [Streptomyces spectabilis]GGU99807.1 MFS transporter [Streptomyces spectabilis]